MKKVLAIVLALAMILGSFSFVAAGTSTEYNDVAGTKYEGAVAVLGALDVVSGYPDGTFKPEKVVTRAEMCKLIIVALGLEDYVAGSYAGYPDVAGSHWATSYIAYATSLGVINGYPDGTFKPENPVTYQEAAAMLVRALGYQDKYLVGTWPASHVNVAVSEGIMKGVKATAEGAVRGDIAMMLYNALTVDMVKYDKWEEVGKSGDSMLSRMGAVKAPGVVFDEGLAHDALKNFGLDLSAYVGAKVDYYWMNVDKDYTDAEPPVAIYDATKGDAPIVIAKEYSTFLTGEFREAAGNDPATFVVGDTTYKFAASALTTDDADFAYLNADEDEVAATDFYNGREAAANTVDPAHKDVYTLAVKLNGVYIEEVYTAAQWVATAEMQWTEDLADELATKKTLNSMNFVKTKADAIDYTWLALEGVEDLATIANDAVVTAYVATVDGEEVITKVGVSTDVATGKITKIAGNPAVYTIGEAGYKQSKIDNITGDLTLGDEGTFFLNYKGEIAFAKADSYAANYAIILDGAQPKATYGAADIYQIYLMTKDGEKAVYDFKDFDTYTAIIAGATDSGSDDVELDDSQIGKLISFKTNADGKIIAASEAATAPATTLTDKGIMNGYLIADDVVVFDVAATKDDPESSDPADVLPDTTKWGMSTVANLKTTGFTSGDVLYALNAKGKISAIVIVDADATKAVSNLGFFTGNFKTYNDKNEAILSGTILQNGAVVDFSTVEITNFAGDLATKVADTDALYKLTYKAGAISGAEAAPVVDGGSYAPLKEASFDNAAAASADALYTFYNGLESAEDDAESVVGTTFTTDAEMGIFDNLYQVLQKADGTVDLGTAKDGDTPAAPNYQYIGAATNVYKINIKYVAGEGDNDGAYEFDKLSIGSASDVKKGAYVMLFQLDKKSGAWDTIVYLTAADAAKLPELTPAP